jgi:LuxR family maltose regulon positive regulatory protein
VLILQALAAQSRSDADGARALLREAVGLAEPEGQVHAFARHGELLVPLLQELALLAGAATWSTSLLDACRATPNVAEPAVPDVSGARVVVEALSARELEVLHLLDTELDGPEIAAHLFVSLNTLRTHTKNIYTKLGVNNRRAAVRRGSELGLLTAR